MNRPRKTDKHLPPRLYVKHGKRVDTYYTILQGKYVGLGGDRREAQQKLQDLIAGKPTASTIGEMCERFIKHLQVQVENNVPGALAARTVGDYTNDLRMHVMPVFGRMPIPDFEPHHKAQYLDRMAERGRAVRANREMAALGSAFNHGIRTGIAKTNPCHGVRRNPEKPRNRRPEIREVNAFLQVAKAKGRSSYMVALIGVMVGVTGRRRAELLELHMSALRDEGIQVESSKIKADEAERTYIVEWTPFLRELVAEARSLPRPVESLFVFTNRSGQPYTDSGFKAMWAKIMAEYVAGGGIRFTAHDLRAMYVTEMLERGQNPETHRNEATTRKVYDRRRRVKVTPLA